jgi:hypothetical protein
MRTLPCIPFRVLLDQQVGAGNAPRRCLLGDHGGMDVLSSRVLLHPTDPERSRGFYRDTLGLAIYREFGSGPERGTVFFLGGGFLELSGRAAAPPAPGLALWLQVRELATTRRELGEGGVPILREPNREPWGLLEMWIQTPMGCGSASWRCRRSIRCAATTEAHLRRRHDLPQWRVPFRAVLSDLRTAARIVGPLTDPSRGRRRPGPSGTGLQRRSQQDANLNRTPPARGGLPRGPRSSASGVPTSARCVPRGYPSRTPCAQGMST